MKTKILTLATVAGLFLLACQNNPKSNKAENKNNAAVEKQEIKTTDIAFTEAKKYFVKNTVKSLDNPKIETAEKFNETFGMATTMSKDGKPTEIDFEKQNVIAVILSATDIMTTIEPVSLQKDENGKMVFTYKIVVGQKQSYTTKPSFLILVDKTEIGNVELKEQK